MSDAVTTWQPRVYEEAAHLLKHAPAQLTAAHVAQLEIFDPALAQHGLEQRFKALHPPSPAPPRTSGIDVEAFGNAVVEVIKGAVAPLVARLERLERQPALKFAGPYREGVNYLAGSLVQRQGLWLAESDTHAAPGEDHSGWRLILKVAK
jgi:hypothetical protein